MLNSIEATIQPDGQVRLKEQVHLSYACRAIVTIIEEPDIPETAALSEPALAEDWNRPEEGRTPFLASPVSPNVMRMPPGSAAPATRLTATYSRFSPSA